MHVGPAASASQTIFARARRAHGPAKASAAIAAPVAASNVSSAAASGAPAAPAAPNLASLYFARKPGVMNS